MIVGQGDYRYEVVPHWAKFPADWNIGWISAVAADSMDRVFLYSRSGHPVVVLDADGNFLSTWGAEILQDAHGLFIDDHDIIYCVERNTHVLRKFTSRGRLLMTLGTPGLPGEGPGDPFNRPTGVALSPDGYMYISDGYGNSRVHKFTPDGRHVLSWGEPGDGPGQFNIAHEGGGGRKRPGARVRPG